MNHKIRAIAASLVLPAAIALAACGGHKPAAHLTPQQKAALAPYSAFVQKQVAAEGGYSAIITSHAKRHDLFLRLKHAVPKQERQAFLNQAATQALHAHLFTHGGRVTFFTVTLPADLKNDGAKLS